MSLIDMPLLDRVVTYVAVMFAIFVGGYFIIRRSYH